MRPPHSPARAHPHAGTQIHTLSLGMLAHIFCSPDTKNLTVSLAVTQEDNTGQCLLVHELWPPGGGALLAHPDCPSVRPRPPLLAQTPSLSVCPLFPYFIWWPLALP